MTTRELLDLHPARAFALLRVVDPELAEKFDLTASVLRNEPLIRAGHLLLDLGDWASAAGLTWFGEALEVIALAVAGDPPP